MTPEKQLRTQMAWDRREQERREVVRCQEEEEVELGEDEEELELIEDEMPEPPCLVLSPFECANCALRDEVGYRAVCMSRENSAKCQACTAPAKKTCRKLTPPFAPFREFQYRALQEYESTLAREPKTSETQVRCHVANMATQIFRTAWQHQSHPRVFAKWSVALRELQHGREYMPRRRQPLTPIAGRTRAMALAALLLSPGPAPLSGVTGASRYRAGPTTPSQPVYSQHAEEELRAMHTGVVARPALSPEEMSTSDDESQGGNEPHEGE
ncbi:hypothetical protein KEM55_000532, partial [Ascosphaera atra]